MDRLFMEKAIFAAAFILIIILLFIFFCCDLYLPPPSFDGPFKEPTPTPTPIPVPSPSPTPTIPPDGNMIYNADFENNLDRWTQWINKDEDTIADISVVSGVCVVDIEDGRDTNWYIQLYQHPLIIMNGKKYTLSFDARADAARVIDIGIQENGIDNNGDGNSYSGYGWFVVDLTPDWVHYGPLECVMYEITDLKARLIFDFGGDDNDAYLDNIMLVQSDP